MDASRGSVNPPLRSTHPSTDAGQPATPGLTPPLHGAGSTPNRDTRQTPRSGQPERQIRASHARLLSVRTMQTAARAVARVPREHETTLRAEVEALKTQTACTWPDMAKRAVCAPIAPHGSQCKWAKASQFATDAHGALMAEQCGERVDLKLLLECTDPSATRAFGAKVVAHASRRVATFWRHVNGPGMQLIACLPRAEALTLHPSFSPDDTTEGLAEGVVICYTVLRDNEDGEAPATLTLDEGASQRALPRYAAAYRLPLRDHARMAEGDGAAPGAEPDAPMRCDPNRIVTDSEWSSVAPESNRVQAEAPRVSQKKPSAKRRASN